MNYKLLIFALLLKRYWAMQKCNPPEIDNQRRMRLNIKLFSLSLLKPTFFVENSSKPLGFGAKPH